MCLRSWATYTDRMPAIVIHMHSGVVPNDLWTIPQIEGIMYVAVHNLNTDEIISSASIEEEQAIWFQGLETEVNVDTRISLEHG